SPMCEARDRLATPDEQKDASACPANSALEQQRKRALRHLAHDALELTRGLSVPDAEFDRAGTRSSDRACWLYDDRQRHCFVVEGRGGGRRVQSKLFRGRHAQRGCEIQHMRFVGGCAKDVDLSEGNLRWHDAPRCGKQ